MNCPNCGVQMKITDQKVNIERSTSKTLFRCMNCGFTKGIKRFVELKRIQDQILVIQ